MDGLWGDCEACAGRVRVREKPQCSYCKSEAIFQDGDPDNYHCPNCGCPRRAVMMYACQAYRKGNRCRNIVDARTVGVEENVSPVKVADMVVRADVLAQEIRKGNWDFVNSCLDSFEHDIVNEACSDNGQSILHRAAIDGTASRVTQLLKLMADPRMKDCTGETPIDLAISRKFEDCVASMLKYTFAIPSPQEPILDANKIVAELVDKLNKSMVQGPMEVILPDFPSLKGKFPEPKVVLNDLKEKQAQKGQQVMLKALPAFAMFVGHKKCAALFDHMRNTLQTAFSEHVALGTMQHFLDWRNFSTARHVQLNMQNPFFSSTISTQNSQFFKEFGIEDIYLFPGFDSGLVITNLPGSTPFQRLCESLDTEKYPRFCIDLTQAPNGLLSAPFFRMQDGKAERIDLTIQQKIDAVDTIGLFYAESMHVVLHVMQYYLLAALGHVSENSDEDDFVQALYSLFHPLVEEKLFQVQNLLIHDTAVGDSTFPGILVTQTFQANVELYHKALSDILKSLGRGRNAFELLKAFSPQVPEPIANMDLPMELPPPGAQKPLAEMTKHFALIDGYSTAVIQQFSDERLAEIDLGLSKFFKSKGLPIEVDSLKQWIELMSATGLIHGTTISMTRLFFSPPGLSYVNKIKGTDDADGVFTKKDFEVVAVALATIAGTVQDREVFPDLELLGQSLGWKGGGRLGYAMGSFKVALDEFVKKSNNIKKDSFEWFKTSMKEDIDKHGWMFSDYFPSGTSINQLTLTTYV